MSTLDEATIRELAALDGGEATVVSCYLDLDGRRYVHHGDYEAELDRMRRDARASLNGQAGASDADLDRIDRFVRNELDRHSLQGVAIFCSEAIDLWKVIELRVPVYNQLVVAHAPAVRQLERILHRHERFGVLVADKQRARVFAYRMGELVDQAERFDALPRHDDDGGVWDKDHVKEHAAAAVAQHLRHAARVALDVYQSVGFDHFAIGAPDEIAHQLESVLHPYLTDRLVGRVSVVPSASEEEIRQATLALEVEVEAAKEAELVSRLKDSAATSGGVVGLAETLSAVGEKRVELLVVSRGFETAGWRCQPCSSLATIGRECQACGAEMDRFDDIVEEAVEEVINAGGDVVVCDGNADLDVVGRIGALLRF